MEFSSTARWIWTGGEAIPRNYWLRARRSFMCPNTIQRATLLVTADSRYELYLNGEWLGFGPVRSYPWAYSYDQYEVTDRLLHGKQNTLALRVVHWGDHSFQYPLGRAGLLCELILELTDGSEMRIASDEHWRVSQDVAMRRDTQRMAPQFGFEEHYDGRHSDEGWNCCQYCDKNWHCAQVIGEIGIEPWTQLIPRSVPFLTRDAVYPTRLVAAELAQPLQGYRWSLDHRRRLRTVPAGIGSIPSQEAGRIIATEIVVDYPCTIKLHRYVEYASFECSVGGQIVKDYTGIIPLQPGRTLFVAGGSAEYPTLMFETDAALRFDASRIVAESDMGDVAAWAYCAPFDEQDGTYQRFYEARTIYELPETPRQAIAASENLAPDIFLLTKTQRFFLPDSGFCDYRIAGPQPRQLLTGLNGPLIEQPSALVHKDARSTILYPQQNYDLHLVIEFERLLVGFLVIEVDAPEGTIIDANMFEVIDESGIYWTNLVHNSLRYTCREGHQVFRSSVRRGFRYLSLTIRGASRPVKIHNVHCLMSTYPVEKRGQFTCNDPLLTKIWDIASYTVQLCMEDTYVDCPTYEQTFYVGDARNMALINGVTFGAYDLTDRCIRLTAETLSSHIDEYKPEHRQGSFHLTTDHVVSGWFNVIPMWSMMWIWNVWEHYQLTGRKETLIDLYPAVQECLRRCTLHLTDRHLLDLPDVSNLVDWTPMDMPRVGEITATNALFVECLRRAVLMAEELAVFTDDKDQQKEFFQSSKEYDSLAELVYQAINTYCWSEERHAYIDCVRDEYAYKRYVAFQRSKGQEPEAWETYLERGRISEPTNTLVLLCRCAPDERIQWILPLIEAAETEDFVNVDPGWMPSWTAEKIVPVGSPWFLFFTMEALIGQGQIERVINVIRKHWGYMLDKGSTTFWEMFRYWTNEHWTRSMCHGWAGGPAYFLSTQILGVQVNEPGYKRVHIAPQLADLTWARGIVTTPAGDVAVHWILDQKEATWIIEVALPQGIAGELVAPSGYKLQAEPITEEALKGIKLEAGSHKKYHFYRI